MPLPDTPYTRAKAGFKLLQYMAAGVPVVASPVGINRQLVGDSGSGFLAEGPDEWEAAIRSLAGDAVLREHLGSRGRAFIERYADLDGQADALAELLRVPRPETSGPLLEEPLDPPRSDASTLSPKRPRRTVAT